MSIVTTFTVENLIKIAAPGLPRERAITFFPNLVSCFEQFEINTVDRISAFLGQVLVESSSFSRLEESLFYTKAERLKQVFRKYFSTLEQANQYLRNPEKLANYVYANRIGNGNEATGDGWNFRGRGLIQTTGRGNYSVLAKATNIDCLENPSILLNPKYACISAGYFFNSNNLNSLADKQEFNLLTKKVNAASLELQRRTAFYNRSLAILKG